MPHGRFGGRRWEVRGDGERRGRGRGGQREGQHRVEDQIARDEHSKGATAASDVGVALWLIRGVGFALLRLGIERERESAEGRMIIIIRGHSNSSGNIRGKYALRAHRHRRPSLLVPDFSASSSFSSFACKRGLLHARGVQWTAGLLHLLRAWPNADDECRIR